MMRNEGRETAIIAVCGKGGAGKTSISAITASILSEDKSKKVLAIDADPAVGLALALGFSAGRTVDDIRNELIQKIKEGSPADMRQDISAIDCEVFAALEEKDNLAFLAIGRPEQEGCYCRVNDFLKDVIESISSSFDYVIIDGEAGVEQINRRVMERVTHLVLVSDESAKGLGVAATIMDVARNLVRFDKCGLLINRVRECDEEKIASYSGHQVIGVLPEEDLIRVFDMKGMSMLELPECRVKSRVRESLASLGLMPSPAEKNNHGE